MPFGALLARINQGEKRFLSAQAWNTLKARTRQASLVEAFSLRPPRPRVILVANSRDAPTSGRSDAKAKSARDPPTSGTSDAKDPATAANAVTTGPSPPASKKSNTRDGRTQCRCACLPRFINFSIGALFITIGAFILVLMPVQLEQMHCQSEDSWHQHCVLWAQPLLYWEECPCTILQYRCGPSVQLGWQHPEVLFDCNKNVSKYDVSSYSPATLRLCDSNHDCNSFTYCNANGRCAECNLCSLVCIHACGLFAFSHMRCAYSLKILLIRMKTIRLNRIKWLAATTGAKNLYRVSNP